MRKLGIIAVLSLMALALAAVPALAAPKRHRPRESTSQMAARPSVRSQARPLTVALSWRAWAVGI
jgi:hypothetical protein